MDFVLTEQVLDQVIAVLHGYGANRIGGLPASWFPETATPAEVPLVWLDHGDPYDFKIEDLVNDFPLIYVRSRGIWPNDREVSGPMRAPVERCRLVHARKFDQCRTNSGTVETNMTRARARYTRLISLALHYDPNRRLALMTSTVKAEKHEPEFRVEAELTTLDSEAARIHKVEFKAWDHGADPRDPGATTDVQRIRQLQAQVWAVACDFDVELRVGGET